MNGFRVALVLALAFTLAGCALTPEQVETDTAAIDAGAAKVSKFESGMCGQWEAYGSPIVSALTDGAGLVGKYIPGAAGLVPASEVVASLNAYGTKFCSAETPELVTAESAKWLDGIVKDLQKVQVQVATSNVVYGSVH